ncbi:energy-coupling factor transporter transmembrane component T family protein [Granulicoccus phenolivorans]|uniref:energy-coupling factor transporter transmembrane component T family protein n=1 Tax=Granulicoccus phenolivorans TaxID=266854 RepID=UPI000417C2C4|nr:energy-coupling factor transporter transmembrane protein EcfT [Granulicoccus phenolivorans]
MLSLYQPGTSPVHRCPAWVKLLAMLVLGTAAFFLTDLRVLGAGLAVVIGAYAVARIPIAAAWKLLRGVLVMLVIVVLAQGLLGDWPTAAQVGIRLLLVIGLANLITLTTTQTAIVDTVERIATPLRVFGVRPDRIGLLIALVFRFIPVIATEAARVREAHEARGVRPGLSYLAPLVIRTLRMADGLGEALEVRGVGEDDPPRRRGARVRG